VVPYKLASSRLEHVMGTHGPDNKSTFPFYWYFDSDFRGPQPLKARGGGGVHGAGQPARVKLNEVSKPKPSFIFILFAGGSHTHASWRSAAPDSSASSADCEGRWASQKTWRE
jgi:hypothetical protein